MNALLPLAAVVVSGGGVLHLFVALIVVWILYWVLTQIPAIDAGVLRVARLIALDGHAFIEY